MAKKLATGSRPSTALVSAGKQDEIKHLTVMGFDIIPGATGYRFLNRYQP